MPAFKPNGVERLHRAVLETVLVLTKELSDCFKVDNHMLSGGDVPHEHWRLWFKSLLSHISDPKLGAHLSHISDQKLDHI